MLRVQNCTAKMVLNRSKYESHTQAFIELHWLPIRQWTEYKILSLVFNCINKTAPQYLIHWKEAGRYGLWSGNSHRLLKIPATKRKTFANHSFSVAGPKLWNSLPDYLRLSSTTDEFKKDIKTHIFRQTFHTSITKPHFKIYLASHFYNHYHISLHFYLMLLSYSVVKHHQIHKMFRMVLY